MTSPIETILDELRPMLTVDRAMRVRLLVEAHDHCTTSAAELVRDGAAPEDAERLAVERFGTARMVAHSYVVASHLRTHVSGHQRAATIRFLAMTLLFVVLGPWAGRMLILIWLLMAAQFAVEVLSVRRAASRGETEAARLNRVVHARGVWLRMRPPAWVPAVVGGPLLICSWLFFPGDVRPPLLWSAMLLVYFIVMSLSMRSERRQFDESRRELREFTSRWEGAPSG